MSLRNIALLSLVFSLVVTPSAVAQLVERPMVGVSPDAADVVRLEKTQLGVLPLRRVVLRGDISPSAQAAGSTVVAKSDDPISIVQRGVVYNHAMRSFGLISGEIAFKMAEGAEAGRFNWGTMGLPQRIQGGTTYIVNARTASEFIRVMNMLQASNSVSWVEPSVVYVAYPIK